MTADLVGQQPVLEAGHDEAGAARRRGSAWREAVEAAVSSEMALAVVAGRAGDHGDEPGQEDRAHRQADDGEDEPLAERSVAGFAGHQGGSSR